MWLLWLYSPTKLQVLIRSFLELGSVTWISIQIALEKLVLVTCTYPSTNAGTLLVIIMPQWTCWLDIVQWVLGSRTIQLRIITHPSIVNTEVGKLHKLHQLEEQNVLLEWQYILEENKLEQNRKREALAQKKYISWLASRKMGILIRIVMYHLVRRYVHKEKIDTS